MSAASDTQREFKVILEQLRGCFEELDMPFDSQRAAAATSIIDADRPVRLVVVGEFNSGKSTLVNALCKWNILPVGVIPTTATINVLCHSERPRIHIARRDGTVAEVPFGPEALHQFTARYGDQRDVREVHIEAPNIPEGVVLIDTPGVNDINQARSEIVYEMIPDADALLFVLDAQQPLKKSEVDFLRDRVLGSSMLKIVFVLNHIDRVADPAEIDTAITYVRENLRVVYDRVAGCLGSSGGKHLAAQLREYAAEIPIYAISARQMLGSAIAGQQIEGDPSGLRAEVFGFAAPETKMPVLIDAAVGQTAALIARLRTELRERERIEGSARETVIAEIHRDSTVLRDTRSACHTALQMIENRGRELRWEVERTVEALFADAAGALESRTASRGLEKGLQEVQQEIGRNLESAMDDINQRLRALAAESTRQASAFVPLLPTRPQVDADATEGSVQRCDRLAELIQDPVNQVAFMVLAPLAALLFGWVGLAALAFPFVARLFGNSATHAPLAEIQDRIIQSGRDVKLHISSALNERIEAIAAAVLDILDEPQRRIRTGCETLSGVPRVSPTQLAAIGDRADQFDSYLGCLVARLHSQRHSVLGARRQPLKRMQATEFDPL